MSVRYLFFSLGPAIQKIFELGFELSDEDFTEFTDIQYEIIRSKGENTDKKWYVVDTRVPGWARDADVVADEEEKQAMLDAVAYIHRLTKGTDVENGTFEQKLFFAASKLPSLFSEGTRFFKANFRIIEGGKDDGSKDDDGGENE